MYKVFLLLLKEKMANQVKEKINTRNVSLTETEENLGRKLTFSSNDRSFSACIGRLIREEAFRKGVTV